MRATYIYVRKINKNKYHHSFPAYSFQLRVVVAGACPSSSGHKAGPTLDRLTSRHRDTGDTAVHS